MKMILPAWLTSGPAAPLPIYPVEKSTVYIYGLCDPETHEVRYIGKSVRPAQRLQNHMNEVSNCHRSHWLQSLKRRGLEPYQVIFEEIEGGWPWQECERYWIARARSLGWPLTNNTDGGDGVSGLPAETRAKMAATWKGRKHKPETLEKMRQISSQRRHTDKTKEKMSASHKGRKITWADKVGLANRKISDQDQIDIRRSISEGARVCDLAVKYGVHRTTISKVKAGEYPDKIRAKAGTTQAAQVLDFEAA